MLNESIAREANQEDNCTGHFWEGRFKSQALLDETAIIACMAYVDLNPIRAQMADTPETSDYTSIQERLGFQPECEDKEKPENSITSSGSPLATLLPFAGNSHKDNDPTHIPFEKVNYLALVDWTGKQIRPDKRGVIDASIPDIIKRLNITEENWLEFSTQLESNFNRAVGASTKLKQFSNKTHHRRTANTKIADRIYAIPAAVNS